VVLIASSDQAEIPVKNNFIKKLLKTIPALLLVFFFACSGGDDDDDSPDGDDSADVMDDTNASQDDDASADDSEPPDDTATDDTILPDDTDEDDDSSDDSAPDDTGDDDTIPPVPIFIEGDVYRFDPSFSLLGDAKITVVERPDIAPVLSDAGGHFVIENVFAGDELTLLLDHPRFFPTQTATVVPPAEGMTDLTIQTPPNIVVYALALVMWTKLDEDKCQISATVTPEGSTPFSAGIPGVRVAIDPPVDPESGPFYFLYIDIPGVGPIDIPVRDLTETTDDGGVIFINVPPGEYTLSAQMTDATFSDVLIRCNPGVLVNASPPYGLQMQGL
jgi:hypothetical protein